MPINDHINDLHLQGLAADAMNAEVNFKVYLKLKEVWDKVQELDEYDRTLFVYTKQNAIDRTILYLGRLYDRKSNNYPTRCIDELIDHITKEKIEIYSSGITKIKWKKFTKKYEKLLVDVYQSEEPTVENYLPTIKSYITNEMMKEGSSFKRLKIWRDKFIAHNERYDDKVSLTDEEVEFLISIPKSLVDYLNDFVSNPMIAIQRPGQAYFINKMIEKYLL